MIEKTYRPKVLVLSKVGTGLATIRALSDGSIQIVAAIFDKYEPVKYSLFCDVVDLSYIKSNLELIDWLLLFGKKQDKPIVILPTSDEHALLLAEKREIMTPHYIMWENDYETLMRIINKDQLYQLAAMSDVPIIPSFSEPSLEELISWVVSNPAPYFVKPFYEGISKSNLKKKNLILDSEKKIVDYVQDNGSRALVVQRLIQGGDGYIFDTYGLCNKKGELLTIASHRRWRQQPTDTGTTSFGEIPGLKDHETEALLFEQTRMLLSSIKYHGIFGIEWLLDKKTGIYYLIDFNARPFTSIGHLHACGLNLPLLAYDDLVGNDLSEVDIIPKLKHKFWTDFLLDLWSLQDKLADNSITLKSWFKSILLCRCFAYWHWKDPGPGLYRFWIILKLFVGKILKTVKS